MPVPGGNSRDMPFYLALAQTGLEMVVPIGVGVWLDSHFGWRPWATVAGAALGLVGGIGHMVYLVNHHPEEPPPPDSGEA